MSVQVQRRRGTAAQHATFTGAAGELTVDTTNNRVVVHDGSTVGGVSLAKLSEVGATTLGALTDVDLTTAAPSSGDGLVFDGTVWEPGPAGGGMFKGNNGTVGSRSGDIFRINAQTLTENVTIASTENALAAGPITIDTGVTLTVSGNLSIV